MGPGTVGALVGRVHERDELAAALVSPRSGSGGVLVIEGEPGIGKTRLLSELAHLAGGEGCAVLSARASEFERDLPDALWSEAIGPHLASSGERRVRLLGLLDPQALAGLAPGLLAGSVPGNDLGGSSASDRHRVHRALRSARQVRVAELAQRVIRVGLDLACSQVSASATDQIPGDWAPGGGRGGMVRTCSCGRSRTGAMRLRGRSRAARGRLA